MAAGAGPPARGEIFLVDPAHGGGDPLPWLVVQHSALNAHAPTVVLVALSARPQRAGYPLTLQLQAADTGLAAPLWAKLTQLHTASRHRLGPRVGQVAPALLARVDEALAEILDLTGPG
jgi:mRNA-degrading endonuclease toxin of MazEF toxin-antitoxin module